MIYQRKVRTLLLLLPFIFGWHPVVLAGENRVDPREVAVDRAIGGMEEGSRILSPQTNEERGESQKIPGGRISPEMDTGASAGGVASHPTGGGANLGGGAGAGTGPAGAGAGVEPGGAAGGGEEVLSGGGAGEVPGQETGGGTTTGGSQESSPETAPGESTNASIIDLDVGAGLSDEGANVDANLAIDPNAGGGLLDVDAGAGVDAVEQELASDAGLSVDVGEDTTHAESFLGTEMGTSDAPPEGEVEAGLEADVEGTGEGDDVSADPADGLSSAIPGI